VLAELDRFTTPGEIPRLLVDIRSAESFPSNEELMEWFWQHPTSFPKVKRLALVASELHAETIRAIADGHESQGTPARIFEDELEALTWAMRARGESSKRESEAAFSELASVRIFVSDIERAREFYSDVLGLGAFEYVGCEREPLFRLNNACFLIEPVDQQHSLYEQLVGRVTGVSFRVRDIDGIYARLSSEGVEFCSKPEQRESGERRVDFHDPDNNVLTLVS
jgi:catechol 2,3-dioxygenase-like lactoylglutathione lyase family enzyme